MKFIRVLKSSLLNENSLGEPIADNEQTLRNFWNWFGDSKMVDEKGRPIVFYHGTIKKFDTFSHKYNRSPQKAFFFAPLKRRDSFAGYYAGDKGTILSVYLKILDPFVCEPGMKDLNESMRDYGDGFITYTTEDRSRDYYNYQKDKLEVENLEVGDIIEVGVFESNQIKSISNNINYSKEDNSIYGSIK